MLKPTSAIMGQGLGDKVAFITDGRFSGGTHGFVVALKEAATMAKDEIVLVNMSGRGDKDIFTIADALDYAKWKSFIGGKADQYRAEKK